MENYVTLLVDGKQMTLSIHFLEILLENDEFYSAMKNTAENNFSDYFSVNTGEFIELYGKKLHLISVLNLIKKEISMGKLILTDVSKKRYIDLLNMVSFEKFSSDYKDKNFNINLGNKTIEIPCKYFIDFIQSNDMEYDSFFDFTDEKYKGIDKINFIYGFINFIKRNLVLLKYVLDDKLTNRINEIIEYKNMDIEYLYYHNDNMVTYQELDSIKINEEFKNAVLDGIPSGLDPVKKAVYIYIKLCKLLAYDNEFFALGQGLLGVEKHHGIKNIENVTLENNEIVCYEFCAIYAKFLKELGFHYEIEGIPYGMHTGEHQYLKTLLNKYFVSIDSVTSVLYGDMTRAKLNKPLEGINCLNKSEKSRKEFELMVTEMYSLIVKNEDKIVLDYSNLSFDEILREYKNSSKKVSALSLESRLRILIEKARSAKFKPIDTLGYIKQLINALFNTSDETRISFSIVCGTDDSASKKVSVNTIFTVNEFGKILYLLYDNSDITVVTKEEIKDMFENKRLSYIDGQSVKIPGIGVC